MFLFLLMALFMGQSIQPTEPVQNVVTVQETCTQEKPIAEAKNQTEEQAAVETVVVKQSSICVIQITGKLESPDEITKKVIEAAENPKIKGILLVIDSGGGSVGSSEYLFREIQELVRQKPVVTLAINFCTSGAYLVASATDWIIAQASTSIGGIGVKYVIEKHKNCKHSDNNYAADIEFAVVSAGKFKVTTDPNADPMSGEQKAFIQSYVNDLYHIFTSNVWQARGHVLQAHGFSWEKVSEWADGKSFTGAQALNIGLIDQVGGRSDAVKKLNELIADCGTVATKKLALVG